MRARLRQAPRALTFAALMSVLAAFTAVAQVPSVQGAVRNESGRPVEQALVLLNPGAGQREVRTDADGRFQFLGVSSGTHRLRVTRIGFQPDSQVVDVGASGAELTIRLRRLTTLMEVAVVARATGVYGTVLSRDELQPIAGARVELLGGRSSDTTDATGSFSMPGASDGTFMLRVSSTGYDTRLLSVRLPKDTAVGIDLVLRPGSDRLDNHMEMLWADMSQRIHWRGVNSSVVGREELLGRGRSMEIAIRFAPSYARKGLVIDERACVFVDGMPRPNATIKDFDVEEIESIEVYGSRSEQTGTLMSRWPRQLPCGNPNARPAPGKTNRALMVSIWTRK
jgi:hypothetical protein